MRIELTEQDIKNLIIENAILKAKLEKVEEELEDCKRELRRPERMTEAENRAYWGIFG